MLYIAYFSPTGTTRRIAASVGKALFETFLCRTQVVDLTPPAARRRCFYNKKSVFYNKRSAG